MANTENIEAKLCAYIDGDLDAAGRAEIEKHLAANPQHRGLIEQLSRQRDLLRQLPRESAPDEILDALQSQMERSVLLGDDAAGAEAEAMKIQRWPQLLAAAAILMLTVGLGAVIYFVLPKSGSTGNYAHVAGEPGATLDGAAASGPATSELGGAGALGGGTGALEDRSAVTRSKSFARDEASATTPAIENDPQPSIAMSPAAVAPPAGAAGSTALPPSSEASADRMLKEKAPAAPAADPFAPTQDPLGAALAKSDVLDAQHRLQNADIAKHLKGTPGAVQDNAMFIVVSTADPSAARSEVKNYLASNKIAWDDVLHPTPELRPIEDQRVNLSRAQDLSVQLKQGPALSEQQRQSQQSVAAAAPPGPHENKQEARGSTASGATGSGPTAAGGQPVGEAEKDAEQPARRRHVGEADAGEQPGQPLGDTMTNAIQPNPGLEQAHAVATTQARQQLGQLAQARSDAGARVIIARGMTQQQAAELSSNLSKQTTVQRAAVYEQRPLPAARAAAISDATGSATTGPAPATAPFTVAQEFSPDPALTPTTKPADAGLDAVAAAPTTQQDAIPTTTTAPSPIPLAAAGAEPATQPLGSPERVDVVILVEDDVQLAPPPGLTDPTALPASPAPGEAQPNAAPTTGPSPLDAPAVPATQPA